MYPQNNLGAGAQWQFATVIVVVVLALGLGILVSNSELFHPKIASAAAEGMAKKDDIAYQKELLNLETLRNATLLEAEQAKLTLENQKEADRQLATFRQGFYETLNSGIFVLILAVSLAIVTWSIMSSLKSYKLALLEAETIRNIQIAVRKADHHPSAAAQQARATERLIRQKNQAQSGPNNPSQNTPSHIEYLYTRPFWPADGD
jgi:hypothetical protein